MSYGLYNISVARVQYNRMPPDSTEQNNPLCLHDSPGRTCHTAAYIPRDYLGRERQNWAREDGGRAGSIRPATGI